MKIHRGSPLPFGVSVQGKLTNFAIIAPYATSVTLCLFEKGNMIPIYDLHLIPEQNKTGEVWHISIEDLDFSSLYAYRINPTLQSKQKYLLDPYAKNIYSGNIWGAVSQYHPLSVIQNPQPFDWNEDRSPGIPTNQLIIYEMHVRAFTQDLSSKVSYPGTFLGVIDKIPHLLELGINAVELLPIHEFNEMEYRHTHPHMKLPLYNFWGYSTVNFFSPMNRYASCDCFGAAINEFKAMVKALHENGIEVILDVVFNHTAEGDKRGPILSFKGIDNKDYYLLDHQGDYLNFSGCGNTVNANHPIVQDLIISSLRYWVTEMHVDGFRFDLSSALTRGVNGYPMNPAPIIEMITHDPVLSSVKLIAEPWDAVGLHQLGAFGLPSKRWSEWNGRYRDCVRQFIKGSPFIRGELATRLSGSQDLYYNRAPYSSINFVTAHDGFTLADLVSYNKKHNLSNGEDNRDGTNDNESWNCGIEGKTTDKKVLLLRERQMRNIHLSLMVSQGIPMLHMGDEYGHTKLGNNNTWCHDDELNWFLWDHLIDRAAFYRFYCAMIHFRKKRLFLQKTTFLTDKDIHWHGLEPDKPDWSRSMPFLSWTLKDHEFGKDLYIAFNAHDHEVMVTLPEPPLSKYWRFVVNTANISPNDYFEDTSQEFLKNNGYLMASFSAIVLELA